MIPIIQNRPVAGYSERTHFDKTLCGARVCTEWRKWMFCYQCEQTAHGTGCDTTVGICGKSAETSDLQDAMIYLVKGISQYAHAARKLGFSDPDIDSLTLESIFMTLTNVNFDETEHYVYIKKLSAAKRRAKVMYGKAWESTGETPQLFTGPAAWEMPDDNEQIAAFAKTFSILKRINDTSADVVGLQEMLTYGIKGLAAYAHHAQILGYTDPRVPAFVHEAFSYLTSADQTEEQLLAYCMKAGEINYIVMELLDKAHTDTFGHPVPTQVRVTPVKGKSIVVSGHDMRSLYELLKQTEGKGINVYTHGELLPAHGYPVLKKFPHLVGNFGTAWQNQVREFADFPGAIVMTTNCLKPPAESYKDRLFTMDVVGWQDVAKVHDYDYSAVIEAALKAPGFTVDEPVKEITVGFGHNAVLGVSDKVIEAIKAGKIRHFFLVGGCDGHEAARNYYTELAESIPSDCVILTLGCGKFRFNMEDFGTIDGIPRLLDMGQCNDAFSAIKVAVALAEAFGCGVNDLPLSIVLSWFEQKAIAVLLTLFYLGVKNVRTGPNLPAFATPRIVEALVNGYAFKPTGEPDRDLADMLTPTKA
jgi:hydroxylamine reductase